MSNTTLTADIIAKEAVAILENQCVMGKLVYRGYEDEFSKKVNGYEVGETISVRRPADFTVRDGRVAAVQDAVEGKFTMTVDTYKGVDFKFTSEELTLQIGELGERVIKPAMVQLANTIDRSIMSLYKKVPNLVTLPSGGMDSFSDFLLAPTRMNELAVPMDDRCAVLNPTDHAALLGSQAGLYISDVAKSAYRNGSVGMIAGIDTYMSQNAPAHTHGSRTGTDTVGAAFTGDTWASTKDTNQSTITVSNMSGATVTLAEGDTITIADVYDVDPVSKAAKSHLKQFVVTAAYTASGSSITSVVISPAIIASGAHATVAFASGVTDLNTKVITYKGAASTSYRENLFFRKNAFALAMVPLVSPPGAVDVGRRSHKGFSVRVIPYFDGTNDVSNWRLDVLYGVKCIDARQAVRASLAADVA
jgi:hypothetical protein